MQLRFDSLGALVKAIAADQEDSIAIVTGEQETGGRRSVQLVLPDSAYEVVGVVPPRPRARTPKAPDHDA